MKRIHLWSLAVLAVAAFALLTGFRPAGGPGFHRGLDERIERALDEIDATDAQRARIREIRDRLKARLETQKADRAKHRQEMKEEQRRFWTSEEPDVAELRARIDERIERHRAHAYAVADAMVEIHGVLTPEQRAQVADLVERHMERKRGRMGRRHGGPPAE